MSGPWRVGDYFRTSNFPYSIYNGEGAVIATVMTAADARLVAAAPKLLVILDKLAKRVLDDADNTPYDTAQEALAFIADRLLQPVSTGGAS